MEHKIEENMLRSLCAGAVAGLTVDLGLYPIDTLKTRLQSAKGFLASGGFRHVYRGMSSVALGSAPGSALFFCTYVTTKNLLQKENPLIDACAAGVGEIIACIVRVPTELIKQRAQAKHSGNISQIRRLIFKNEGFFGFYRGYLSTVSREIPFSLIEFPVWEALKKLFSRYVKRECNSFESAACGSVAGSIAGAITTPLDVAKTRIMLDETLKQPKISTTLLHIFRRGGLVELYSGILPRTAWLGFGGFLFFGAFENALRFSYWMAPS